MTSETRALRKILYVAMRFDYGKPDQGTSFEFNNFYRTLQRMIPHIIEFDFMTVLQQRGKEVMNRLLLETAQAERPDLIFCILFTDELMRETIAELTRNYVTFNWFCDDHWRFSGFSKYYAPCFAYVSTTDPKALPRYEKIGYKNALRTEWAANHFDYVRLPAVEKTYDVTFVGQPHGNRRSLAAYLRRHGVQLQTFGMGWDNGRVSQEEMIRIFNSSRVNLNLSNSSWNIHSIFRRRQQIKGRNFEIPGCGGFLLTDYVEGLENYYVIGEEIDCFSSRQDLLRKIKYYLTHEDERERIASRGYERTLRDHTYEKRLKELFGQMGFYL